MEFFKSEKDIDQKNIETLNTEAVIFYLKSLPESKREQHLYSIRTRYYKEKAQVEKFEKEISYKRYQYLPSGKVSSAILSSLFGLSAKYAYEWFSDGGETEETMIFKWGVQLVITLSSMSILHFLQNLNETESLEAKIAALNDKILHYRNILAKFGEFQVAPIEKTATII